MCTSQGTSVASLVWLYAVSVGKITPDRHIQTDTLVVSRVDQARALLVLAFFMSFSPQGFLV